MKKYEHALLDNEIICSTTTIEQSKNIYIYIISTPLVHNIITKIVLFLTVVSMLFTLKAITLKHYEKFIINGKSQM